MTIDRRTGGAELAVPDDPERYAEAIAALTRAGLAHAADRLSHLATLPDDEPDEPPIAPESLDCLVSFLVAHRHLAPPAIGVTDDGLAEIVWRTSDRGLVKLDFLPTGWVRFAGVSAGILDGDAAGSVSGIYPVEHAMAALTPFIEHVPAA